MLLLLLSLCFFAAVVAAVVVVVDKLVVPRPRVKKTNTQVPQNDERCREDLEMKMEGW